MPNRFRTATVKGLSLFLSASMAYPPSLWANPTDGVVVGGEASISGEGSTVTIEQHTDRAIIDWGGFSIGAGELTQFIQPSELSAVLNRVTGGDPSAIYGTLQANGQVYLINPNGILVGPGGAVNTQGFVASTLDVDDDAFLAGGDLLFSGGSLAGVQNQGSISALGGNVVMIARTVSNTGEISAANGTAALAAGSEVLYKPLDEERVFVQAGSETSADIGVDQQGRIEAAAAELKAAGGNVYSLAINNEGVVRADGVEAFGGRVFLTAEGGTVSNSGELGAVQGDVRITGDQVVLEAGSTIDAGALEANADSRILIKADVATSGDQTYNGAVDVGANATLDAGGHIRFSGAVDSSNLSRLTTSSQGDTTFSGAVGADSLGDLNVTSGGELYFEGTLDSDGSVTTVSNGYTDFYDAVGSRALGGLNVTSGREIYFEGTLDSNAGAELSMASGGDVMFYDAVGADSLGDLSVTTAEVEPEYEGEEVYGGRIEFQGTLDSDGSVTTVSNDYTDFYDAVGSRALGDLNVTSGGELYFEGTLDSDGSVTTVSNGYTDFYDAVGSRALGGLNVTSGREIYFEGTLDSNAGAELSMASGGDVMFYDAVGADSLGDLSVTTAEGEGFGSRISFQDTLDSDGSVALRSAGIELNGGDVTTRGGQTYTGAVNVGRDSTLSALGDVAFNGPVTAGNLTVHGGDVSWNGVLAGADLRLFGTNLLMNGAVESSGENGVLMVAENSFSNPASAGIAVAEGAKWLIYSADPALDVRGGLSGGEQFSTTYAGGPAPSFEENGFLYSSAEPSIELDPAPIQQLPDSENLEDFQANLGQTFVDASGSDLLVDASGQDAQADGAGTFNDIAPESDLKDAVSDEPQSSSDENGGKGKKGANTTQPQPRQK